jgi:hypothetical protein
MQCVYAVIPHSIQQAIRKLVDVQINLIMTIAIMVNAWVLDYIRLDASGLKQDRVVDCCKRRNQRSRSRLRPVTPCNLIKSYQNTRRRVP